MRHLYTATVFLSSFLLFLVQPLIAKRLLPTFGGSPLVWNTSMLFFQVVLLGGYLYAHSSTHKLGMARQPKVHLALLFAGLAVLPIRLPSSLLNVYHQSLSRDANSLLAQPSVMLLAMLFVSVGVPFFVLSAGAPLLQRWFSHTDDPSAHNPYFLYRASNVGSLLALLCYPFVIEPRFTLSATSAIWSAGYLVLGVLMVACAVTLHRRPGAAHDPVAQASPPAPIGRGQKLTWVALAAGPAAALLGVTGYLTTNVAPVPLLWVMPLSLYLITFIIAFAERNIVPQALMRFLTPAAVFAAVSYFALGRFTPLLTVVSLHLACFFVVALACHGQLAATKPEARNLTQFYLWISLGGAIGGFFSSILAPILLTDKFEYPGALAFSGIALGLASFRQLDRKRFGFVALTTVLAACCIGMARMTWHGDAVSSKYYWLYFGAGFLALTSYSPVQCGLALCAFVGAACFTQYSGVRQPMHLDRSFFGVHHVHAMGLDGNIHRLVDGNTVHGAQDFTKPREPLTYFSYRSGAGKVFLSLGNTPRFDDVAIVGLGIGTLTAYGRPGQRMDVYELDPAVLRVASDRRLFTYLTDSRADVHVILGDARLRLADAQSGGYGFLIIDAFASDAIPVHLLTKEAFGLYLSKMRPDGLLAVHISNKYLKLEPVVAALARDYGLHAWIVDNTKYHKVREHREVEDSRWILLAHDPKDLGPLVNDKDLEPLPKVGNKPAWTDDFSDVLSALDWKQAEFASGH